jgi:hypothetical protein
MIGWMRRYTEAEKRELDFLEAPLYWLAGEDRGY